MNKYHIPVCEKHYGHFHLCRSHRGVAYGHHGMHATTRNDISMPRLLLTYLCHAISHVCRRNRLVARDADGKVAGYSTGTVNRLAP